MLKIKELTHVNEVLSMSVTKLLDIIDRLYLVFVHKVKSLSYNVQEQGLLSSEIQGVDFRQWNFEYERNDLLDIIDKR